MVKGETKNDRPEGAWSSMNGRSAREWSEMGFKVVRAP